MLCRKVGLLRKCVARKAHQSRRGVNNFDAIPVFVRPITRSTTPSETRTGTSSSNRELPNQSPTTVDAILTPTVTIHREAKMPNCSALKCSNRAPAFKMYRFPSSDARRKIWVENVARKDWTPTWSACLCEIHFESSQFEQRRQDGKKKLRPNAVPTLFSGSLKQGPHLAPPLPASVVAKLSSIVKSDHAYFRTDLADNASDDENGSASLPAPCAVTTPVEVPGPSEPVREVRIQDRTLRKMEDHEACLRKINFYRHEARVAKQKLRESRDRLSALEKTFAKLFNRDQLQALAGKNLKKGCSNWTLATIERALEIHGSVGRKAYNFFRDIGFPLPSVKTLKRKSHEGALAFGEDALEPDSQNCIRNAEEQNYVQILN